MSSPELNKLLTKTLENVRTLVDQLKDESVERSQQCNAYDQEIFWKNLIDSSVGLSHEVTKISLSFSKPPFPAAHSLEPMCTSLEMACLALVSVFYGFPKNEGLTLRKQIRQAVISILESIHGLISDISQVKEGTKEVLRSTGSVWEVAENIKTLPKDNKEAVTKLIRLNSDLINDAQEELETAINECGDETVLEAEDNDDDDDDIDNHWSSAELDICKVSLGLIKTAHACTRKILSVISESDKKNVHEFDDLISKIEIVCPSVDDFVSSLYPPMRKDVIMENATTLSNHLNSLLSTIKSCSLSSDEKWVEFLLKAVDHNLTKVENLTGKSRLG